MSAQTGMLDGIAWCGATEGHACHWYEVMPYFLTNPLCGAWLDHWLVNEDSWNELPPDLQELWKLALGSFHFEKNNWYYTGEAVYRTQPLFTLTTMPPDDWQKILDLKEGEYDRIAATSPRCAQAIDIIRDYQALMEEAGPPYRCPAD